MFGKHLSVIIYLSVLVFSSGASVPDDHSTKNEYLSDQEHFKTGEHNAKYDHDAFVGEEEAKAYERLTPEESKERLAKMLPVIDKDGDGFLEENELKDHIKYMQKRYVLKDIERTWSNYEKEKFTNGKLNWKAYREAIYGPEGQEISKEYGDMMERDKRRWKTADKIADDQLDQEEYTCFMHPESCDHMKDVIVKETVEDIDKNKDGFIDVDEYIRDMYRPEEGEDKVEPDWVKSERDMFKSYRDKNKDGKLDMEEMREWITPPDFDHAEAEAKHLVHLADDDKNGKLTKEEILSHYDVFVGSQATDYGEQLRKHDPSEL